MNNTETESLSAQILAMQTKHRQLDTEINRLYDFPFVDQLEIQRLKNRKLRLKNTIESLKGQLIPDLNA